MMRAILLVTVLAVALIGCGTMAKTDGIKAGMTKQEVLEAFGPPVTLTTRAGDPAEYLHYPSRAISASDSNGATYSIAIVNGRVNAHGESFRLGITDVGF